MGEFTKVAQATELPPGESMCVEFHGERVALFNVDGRIYAIGDLCTHAGGPLSMGHVSGASVICPLHGASFDLETGEAQTAPGSGAVKTYPVRSVGDEIQLGAP